MAKGKVISTNWYHHNKLLVTEISGDIKLQDVLQWEASFHKALERMPDNSKFKILVNLYGFKAVDFEVQKRLRTVVPVTLADYGWKVGYVNLLEEAIELPVKKTRGIRCFAAAHVHRDPTKTEAYEISFGKHNEHFFTDSEKALDWIRKFNLEK